MRSSSRWGLSYCSAVAPLLQKTLIIMNMNSHSKKELRIGSFRDTAGSFLTDSLQPWILKCQSALRFVLPEVESSLGTRTIAKREGFSQTIRIKLIILLFNTTTGDLGVIGTC